jgi:hypothetical protein
MACGAVSAKFIVCSLYVASNLTPMPAGLCRTAGCPSDSSVVLLLLVSHLAGWLDIHWWCKK